MTLPSLLHGWLHSCMLGGVLFLLGAYGHASLSIIFALEVHTVSLQASVDLPVLSSETTASLPEPAGCSRLRFLEESVL